MQAGRQVCSKRSKRGTEREEGDSKDRQTRELSTTAQHAPG